MQTTPTLSNAPAAEQAEPAAALPPTLQAQQLETQLTGLREQARAQEAQLQALQTEMEHSPLQGWYTDAPLGLALEGLLIGLAALALGAGCGWLLAARRAPEAAPTQPAPTQAARSRARRRSPQAPDDFADSMLYLADQEPAPGVQQTVELHTPAAQRPPRAAAHGPADAQGSAAEGPQGPAHAAARPQPVVASSNDAMLEAVVTRGIFGSPVEPSEFDIHAAAGEVERVRNYLAKRRAARAMGLAPHVGDPYADFSLDSGLGHDDTVRLPRARPGPAQAVGDVDIELDFCAALHSPESAAPHPGTAALAPTAPLASPAQTPSAQPPVVAPAPTRTAATTAAAAAAAQAPPSPAAAAAAPTPAPARALELEPATPAASLPVHEEPMLELDLSLGASRLGDLVAGPALDLEVLTQDLALQPLAQDAAAPVAQHPTPPLAVQAAAPSAVPSASDEAVPELTLGRSVQLELAREFMELGLLREARERALEVLQQEQTEFHEPARQLLAQLPVDAPPSTY